MRFLTLLFFSIILFATNSELSRPTKIFNDLPLLEKVETAIVVDGDEEWDALYKNLLQTNPLNNLSDQELGVFIFLGERSSSGYSLDFIESSLSFVMSWFKILSKWTRLFIKTEKPL